MVCGELRKQHILIKSQNVAVISSKSFGRSLQNLFLCLALYRSVSKSEIFLLSELKKNQIVFSFVLYKIKNF